MLHAAAHIPHQQGRPQAATARPRRAEAESFQGDDDEECVCCAAPTGTVDRTQRLQQQRLSLRMHASSALAAAVIAKLIPFVCTYRLKKRGTHHLRPPFAFIQVFDTILFVSFNNKKARGRLSEGSIG